MEHAAFSILTSLGVFAASLAFWEAGWRIGRRRRREGAAEREGTGAVEGSVFGLMGLLLAFSFSGAMTRWDARRSLVVEEANDIGTAWLRLDLLPAADQTGLRELFRRYLDSRLEAYRQLPDLDAAKKELVHGAELQQEIWARAAAACQTPAGERARILLLPALNAMIDITTTRTLAAQMHPPGIINALLVALVLASSLLAGLAMSGANTRGIAHVICFALGMAAAVYLIFELEYPRAGLIRIDAVDQVLVDLRATMN